MNTDNYESNIEHFWLEVQRIYDPIMAVTGLSYYVFQTEYVGRSNPDLMIIGINPGGDYEGEKYLVNKVVGMGPHRNMYVDEKGHWFDNLRAVFDYPNDTRIGKAFDNCIGTNLCYLNTGNEKDLENLIPIEECTRLTKMLIDIIAPKVIVTLGNTPFKSLIKGQKKDYIPVNERNKIWYSFYNNIPVYNLTNPSRNNNHYYRDPVLSNFKTGLKKIFYKELSR